MRTEKRLMTLLGVLAGVLVIGAVAMGSMVGGGIGPGMMYGYGSQAYGMGGWASGLVMGVGVLMMLAFWGVVILGIALLVRWIVGRDTTGTSAEQDPLTILQGRYARGEIDEPTYHRMRSELGPVVGEPTSLYRAS